MNPFSTILNLLVLLHADPLRLPERVELFVEPLARTLGLRGLFSNALDLLFRQGIDELRAEELEGCVLSGNEKVARSLPEDILDYTLTGFLVVGAEDVIRIVDIGIVAWKHSTGAVTAAIVDTSTAGVTLATTDTVSDAV